MCILVHNGGPFNITTIRHAYTGERLEQGIIGYYLTDMPPWRVGGRPCNGHWLIFYRGLPAASPGKARHVDFPFGAIRASPRPTTIPW